jgi:hypothetical protein
MNKLKVFDYQGSKIQFEEVEGKIMANATLMCAAFGKRANDWQNTKSAKRYIEAITSKNGFAENQLLITRLGGNVEERGTWIHEKLILSLARWLNVDFEVWCDERIAELLRTGKTEIKPLSNAEMLLQQCHMLVEQEKRLGTVEQEVREIKAKQTTSPQNYYAISGYASLMRVNVDHNTAQIAGRKASRLCKDLGYCMGSVPDPKYATVKTYPSDVLETVFKDMRLCA